MAYIGSCCNLPCCSSSKLSSQDATCFIPHTCMLVVPMYSVGGIQDTGNEGLNLQRLSLTDVKLDFLYVTNFILITKSVRNFLTFIFKLEKCYLCYLTIFVGS